MLPTLISDDVAVMREAIGAMRDAIAQGVPGVIGIHLEGPYIAPARKGTHDASKFRVPDEDEIALAASLDNGVTLLTLAPERVPLETIRALVERGVIVAAGHTAGTYEEIRAGLDAVCVAPICTTRCRRCRAASRARWVLHWKTAIAGSASS